MQGGRPDKEKHQHGRSQPADDPRAIGAKASGPGASDRVRTRQLLALLVGSLEFFQPSDILQNKRPPPSAFKVLPAMKDCQEGS